MRVGTTAVLMVAKLAVVMAAQSVGTTVLRRVAWMVWSWAVCLAETTAVTKDERRAVPTAVHSAVWKDECWAAKRVVAWVWHLAASKAARSAVMTERMRVAMKDLWRVETTAWRWADSWVALKAAQSAAEKAWHWAVWTVWHWAGSKVPSTAGCWVLLKADRMAVHLAEWSAAMWVASTAVVRVERSVGRRVAKWAGWWVSCLVE